MKKIIFCLQTMVLGGVEKELITVLKKIHNDFDITLLLLYQEDTGILEEIPNNVHVRILNIDTTYYLGGIGGLIRQRLKTGEFIEAFELGAKRLLKVGMTHANTNIQNIPAIETCFDVAVCYHIHAPLMLRYVSEKIIAEKKIGWIHNDFYGSRYPIQQLKRYVVKYDEFVAVSKKVENEFRSLCPWYSGDISTAHNYLDTDEIIERSKEALCDDVFSTENKTKILTVGRFSEQKGIDYAILASSMLKKEKIPFHWFLIGYGQLEEEYRRLIKRYDVEDCFTILGRKDNPYPYIKNCDIYVQPSRHEAFPIVIMEAKALNKPIVCTDYDGADEQICDGETGIIVPVGDVSKLFEAISKLIYSNEARELLSEGLKREDANDDLREIIRHFM